VGASKPPGVAGAAGQRLVAYDDFQGVVAAYANAAIRTVI